MSLFQLQSQFVLVLHKIILKLISQAYQDFKFEKQIKLWTNGPKIMLAMMGKMEGKLKSTLTFILSYKITGGIVIKLLARIPQKTPSIQYPSLLPWEDIAQSLRWHSPRTPHKPLLSQTPSIEPTHKPMYYFDSKNRIIRLN